jgi:bile acid:Na+ symporter, BASS family
MGLYAEIFTIVFLVATMLSIGLKVTMADLAASFKDRGLMARSLAVNFLLIPAIGLLLTYFVPMSPEVKVGFLLLALAPGGLNAVQFTSKTPAGLSYAATLLFVLSFLSVLLSPLMAMATIPLETTLALPYGRAIGFLLLGVLVPMLAGMAVHRFHAKIADKLAKPIALVGTVSFVVVVVLLWSTRKQAKADLTGAELVAMLIFIVVAMVVGWVFGGPARETRQILATGSSMRNAALGLMIATHSFPDNADIQNAVVAFSAMMIPLNMVFTVYGVIHERRAAKKADAAKGAP